MKLTQAKAKLLIWSIGVTIDSELDLIDCHHGHGKCFNNEVVADSRRTIRRLKLLRKELQDLLSKE